MKKTHRGRHVWRAMADKDFTGYYCIKCGKRIGLQTYWDNNDKVPYIGYMEGVGRGMRTG